MIIKGVKKCCISNAADDTHNDRLWNGCEEDGYVRSDLGEGEGTDCEDGDSTND